MNYLVLKSGSFYIPKHNELKPEGEDAHFICDEKCSIGVADGVGGFAKRGIDSGIYARELMTHSVTTIKDRFPGNVVVNPVEVLNDGYSKTKAKGASTACIITLNQDNYVIDAAIVGDSGFMIIRRGRTVYKSPVQQKGFNHPYQLKNNSKSNNPSSAEVIQVGVEVGDVIVTGTDGLFDNMFTEEIESRVRQLGYGVEPQEMALKIAERAFFYSHNANVTSPFQLASAKAGHLCQGGKIDDITREEDLDCSVKQEEGPRFNKRVLG